MIRVEDVNDNAPVFLHLPYYASVQVGAPPGLVVSRVEATDRDHGVNGEVTYRLEVQHPNFQVVVVATGRRRPPPLRPRPDLLVHRGERGQRPCSTGPSTSVAVREDAPPPPSGADRERQRGGGRRVVFTLEEGDPTLQFDVAFDTGGGAPARPPPGLRERAVTTPAGRCVPRTTQTGARRRRRRRAVLESQRQPRVLQPAAYRRSCGNALARPNVLSAGVGGGLGLGQERRWNDNAPDFSQPLYEAHVSELAPRGHFVACVQASDADACDADRLRYAILSGNERMTFALDPRSGELSLSTRWRAGLQAVYLLNVSASDGVFTGTAQVRVRVLGANLYSPVFSQRFYLAEVQENAPSGSKVTQVRATDEDSGLFGRVTYSFVDDLGRSRFSIDGGGVISTAGPLDREDPAYKDLLLTVSALDGGGRASFCTVRVVLADQNDNAPCFRAVEYRLSIRANMAAGSPLTQIQASDADTGANGRVTYALYTARRGSPWWTCWRCWCLGVMQVEADSGWMMTKSAVDHLQGAVLSFFVKASDGGSPARHALASVYVHVLPPDAELPVFSQPQYSFTLPEDAEVGAALGSVYLAGPGPPAAAAGGGGRTLRAVPGETADSNRDGTFAVDAETGAVRLLQPLDYERVSVYRFKVSATTHRDLTEAVTSVDLEVKVLDVNDNRPVFETSTYVATVMEGLQVGTRVVQVRALDPDWGSNGQVTYSLDPRLVQNPDPGGSQSPASSPSATAAPSTASVFVIDSKTGWITTAAPLDHESSSAYSLWAVASDRGEPRPLSATAVVTVAVADVNDSPPHFEREVFRAAVSESDPLGALVAVLSTRDADGAQQNRMVSCYITGGNPRGQFGLARVQGAWKLYVSGLLDRERQDAYLLNVTASDGRYVARAAVEVTVTDANDNSPVCNQAVYRAVYPEDIPANEGILTVGATGCRRGLRRRRAPVLSVWRRRGGLLHGRQLRRAAHRRPMTGERTPGYALVVQGDDGGGLFCRSDVRLRLLDVN
ncbi:hypothetical protein CRUP_003331 [Coryphaenoides rupestris]|nr:hypothetical protein CRUP_003331 [Coryphaenoides rupestris]